MIAMGVVVSVLILGRSGLRSTFHHWWHHLFIYWFWYTMIHIIHVHSLHVFWLCHILSWVLIPFWSWGVGKRGTTGKVSTNKWKVWARFKIWLIDWLILIMILIMIMIIPLIQNNHTGPDILLKKTIQDVLNATLRFWFRLSNTSYTNILHQYWEEEEWKQEEEKWKDQISRKHT